MQTFTLFKITQGCLGRKYQGTKGQFESGRFYGYFSNLNDFLKDKFDYSDAKIRQYISVVSKMEGEKFDPFKLDSDEYMDTFKDWLRVNQSENAYKINIFNSCQHIYNFCKDRNIYTLNEYTKKWGVSHFISGKLNENVAFLLGLHNLTFTKPEKLALTKPFLKNTGLISERMERETAIKSFIQRNLRKVEKKLQRLKIITEKNQNHR